DPPFGSRRARAASPKPHYSDEAGGAGSQNAFQALGIGGNTAPIILGSPSFLPAIPTKRVTLDRATPISGAGQRALLGPAKLNVNLFGNCQRIIHIDAKVSNGALDLPMTKKKLNRP